MTAHNTSERISQLAGLLDTSISQATDTIAKINMSARMLAMNTRVEAARLGPSGATFQVIGGEMVALSERTSAVAQSLGTQTRSLIAELSSISAQLATQVRGTRLADMALTNIDLIDRNLYERSCDCRWWATDSAFVAALSDPSPGRRARASSRMEVILKAYTVYFDIVLADLDGNVIANGRATQFRSQGTNHRNAEWFASAMATPDGNVFGFESVHMSALAGGKRVLVYSAKVCEGGLAHGRPLGVLGIVFKWDALAQTIMINTPVEAADKARTRALITDLDGTILADSSGEALRGVFPSEIDQSHASGKGFEIARIAGRQALIGHARSPGFETYASGWNSYVVQMLE